MGDIIKFTPRKVNGVTIQQRNIDGFINATAMCKAYGKRVNNWFRTDAVLQIFIALSKNLNINLNYSYLSNLNAANLSAKKYVELFPYLVTSKQGSIENGGGTFIHPELAVQLAQWCDPVFAIQVSRWVINWFNTGENPINPNLEKEEKLWEQRAEIRNYVKDFLRPELMDSVVKYAEQNGISPIKLCSQVHDTMNERIQGLKSKEIKANNQLTINDLIRDYFEAQPLVTYAAINKLAKNSIDDSGIEPIKAVNIACDAFLGAAYEPSPVKIVENIHKQGKRIKQAKKQKQLSQHKQLNLFGDNVV